MLSDSVIVSSTVPCKREHEVDKYDYCYFHSNEDNYTFPSLSLMSLLLSCQVLVSNVNRKLPWHATWICSCCQVHIRNQLPVLNWYWLISRSWILHYGTNWSLRMRNSRWKLLISIYLGQIVKLSRSWLHYHTWLGNLCVHWHSSSRCLRKLVQCWWGVLILIYPTKMKLAQDKL